MFASPPLGRPNRLTIPPGGFSRNDTVRTSGSGWVPQNVKPPMPAQQPMQQPAAQNPLDKQASFGNYPSYVYSPQQTEREINLQTAMAQQRANLPNILQQFAGSGFNVNSPSIYAQALSPIMNARVNDIAPRQQFSDSLTNAQFSMQNQGLQHQDQMQNMRLAEMLRQIQFGGQFGEFQDLASLLGALLR